MNPLDNPVWSALCSRHAGLALRRAAAARYPAEVAPFAAVDPAVPDAGRDLAALLAPGDTVLMVGPSPAMPVGLTAEAPVDIAQMLCEQRQVVPDGLAITELGPAQRADLLALTALVYPHYFRPRTPDMGRYLGIYVDGMLAAMAGERMGMDGFQEISAVCTHPAHTGRGHAYRLVATLGNAALDAGRMPLLHVARDNARAIGLYERLGYVRRSDIALRVVRRPD